MIPPLLLCLISLTFSASSMPAFRVGPDLACYHGILPPDLAVSTTFDARRSSKTRIHYNQNKTLNANSFQLPFPIPVRTSELLGKFSKVSAWQPQSPSHLTYCESRSTLWDPSVNTPPKNNSAPDNGQKQHLIISYHNITGPSLLLGCIYGDQRRWALFYAQDSIIFDIQGIHNAKL